MSDRLAGGADGARTFAIGEPAERAGESIFAFAPVQPVANRESARLSAHKDVGNDAVVGKRPDRLKMTPTHHPDRCRAVFRGDGSASQGRIGMLALADDAHAAAFYID